MSPHHLLDIWPVTQAASVSEYQLLARQAIDDIRGRGRTPILVGGSGLYVRAAIDNLEFPGTDPDLRASLEAELAQVGAAALHARLAALDPAAAAAILPGNGRRIVRALEVIELSGQPVQRDAARSTSPSTRSCSSASRCPGPSSTSGSPTGSAGCGSSAWSTRCGKLEQAGLREGRTASRALGYAQVLTFLDGGCTEEAGRRADDPGDPAVRPAPGVVVPPGPARRLAPGRPGPRCCGRWRRFVRRRRPLTELPQSTASIGSCGSLRGTARGTTS